VLAFAARVPRLARCTDAAAAALAAALLLWRAQEVRRARDVRAEVLASLSAHALSGAQQALLRPTSALGQRETMREGLSRALKHQRMGLPVPAEIPLLRERREAPEAEEEAADEAAAEEPETRTAVAPAPPPAPSAGDALAALAARAMGTRAAKPDRQSLKRHKTAAAEAEEDMDAPSRPLAAAAADAAALRPLARAMRADVTGEAEGVADDPHAAERAARRAALVQRPPDEPRKRVVHPPRPADVAEARLKLPILAMEQEIMEAIESHDVVVLCGETGCGKTTQLPQFLYEAGYGTLRPGGGVVVTQPRRVAVTSTAARVAAELGETRGLGGAVGYAVRHDGAVGAKAPLRFVTDGVLLREAQADLLLSRYAAIVVDEAHERSVNTDLLVGLLSRVVPLRARMAAAGTGPGPLKLVVMSATLRVDDFAANARLCAQPPPVLRVPARQFPVTVHFARRTPGADYVDTAFRKVCAIHRKLPPGGVLVFLTGQREVEHLAQRLRQMFNHGAAREAPGAGGTASDVADALGADAFDRDALDAAAEAAEAELDAQFPEAPADDDEDGDSDSASDEEETMMLGGDAPEEDAAAAAAADAEAAAAAAAARAAAPDAGPGPMHVLPLYALLPAAAQARVFAPAPAGARLVVVATNVAETSLTIPGIRYVVDAGRAKARIFEAGSAGAGGGLSRFAVGFVSQASAAQRAGRAGRTGPGHAYRLYSSAHYTNAMDEHAPPELLCVPLESVVLQMKSMGIDRVAGFPFPSPPDPEALAEAEAALTRLGALTAGGALSALGRGMALLPVAPRAGRMLLAVAAEPRAASLLPHAAAIAAALSLESPFLKGGAAPDADGEAGGEAPPPDAPPAAAEVTEAEAERAAWEARGRGRHAKYQHPRSDALSAVAALLAFEAATAAAGGGATGAAAADALCTADALHARTLREMSDLRAQLARLLARHAPALCSAAAEAAAEAGSADDAGSLARPDVAERVAVALAGGAPSPAPLPGGAERALRRALAAGWADRVARRVKPREQLSGAPSRAVRYRAALAAGSGHVFLHPSSSLARSAPEWVVYTELLATGARPYMLGATEIDPAWLPGAAPRLVTLSAPLADPAPRYVGGAADAVVAWRDATYGPQAWQLPRVAAPLPVGSDGAIAAFAAALLEGTVSAAMAPLVPRLAAPPATAARPEARSQRRVGELLHALKRRGIASRAALRAAWRAEPRYLLPELSAWMRAGTQHALERAWPDIVACAPPADEADEAEAERQRKRKKKSAADEA
jgi:ATP-dependent RNA helicase DHX37/DHR1